jgi:hypothetical protein
LFPGQALVRRLLFPVRPHVHPLGTALDARQRLRACLGQGGTGEVNVEQHMDALTPEHMIALLQTTAERALDGGKVTLVIGVETNPLRFRIKQDNEARITALQMTNLLDGLGKIKSLADILEEEAGKDEEEEELRQSLDTIRECSNRLKRTLRKYFPEHQKLIDHHKGF